MQFITYENRNNPHITIHFKGCNQIKKRGGQHTSGQGYYEEHNTYHDAFEYALKKNLKIINCSYCKPNYCYNSLCEDFIIQARKVWNWLKVSIDTNITLSEESITDFILLELQASHPYEIITQKYNRRQEAKVGADWEWWLTDKTKWLGLRIQAKKIDPHNLIYPELPKNNKYGRQVDLLINGALKISPKRVPLYIFYNYWDIQKHNLSCHWNCSCYLKDCEMLGCGLVNAFKVKSVLCQKNNSLQHIMSFMYPWSCLVCCFGYSKDNLPNRAFDFIKKALEMKDILTSKSEFLVKRCPNYVFKVLNGSELTEDEWLDIGVNRITIIKENDKNKDKKEE